MARLTKRQKALDQAGNRCWYCGHLFVNDSDDNQKPCLDHVNPRSKGGGHEINNIVASCRSCNSVKGTKTLEEFRGMYMRGQPAYLARLHLEKALSLTDTPQDAVIREAIQYLEDQCVPFIFHGEQSNKGGESL